MELFERLVNVVDNETNLHASTPAEEASGRLMASFAVMEVLQTLTRSGEFDYAAELKFEELRRQVGQQRWNVVR